MSDPRRIISTSSAPAAIGPYSQAIVANGFVFCSGQIPIDPSTGQIVGSDAREQTERVMANVVAVLEAAGSSLGKVVKVTIFLKSLGDFGVVNEVYSRFFPKDPPARSTIEVARLPRDAMVEIEVLALA